MNGFDTNTITDRTTITALVHAVITGQIRIEPCVDAIMATLKKSDDEIPISLKEFENKYGMPKASTLRSEFQQLKAENKEPGNLFQQRKHGATIFIYAKRYRGSG